MSALLFRAAEPADDGTLSDLCRASVLTIKEGQPASLVAHWATMLSPERMQAIIGTHWTIVAVQDGTPVGFASLEDDVLAMLYVHPTQQGQGIGRALVQEAARAARKEGTRLLRVDASLNALKTYRGWGFVDHGVREKVDTAGVTYRVHRMHALVARLLR